MEHRATLEVIAPSVEDAIEKGLAELGMEDHEVDVEVLDEGSSGLFGLGGRQARIRLTVKGAVQAKSNRPAASRAAPKRESEAPLSDEDAKNLIAVSKATVEELLRHMGVRGQVDAHMGERDDQDGPAPVVVEVHGEDLSILIGRRAETLNALQLITRMIVGKEVGHAAHLVIDIEGYRERRAESLRQLAQKMAKQAISTGRRQSLEPMTPAERRIIHMELRESNEVSTESVGDEPKRKVVIIPR
jgi:spoIIIJ-associated protein